MGIEVRKHDEADCNVVELNWEPREISWREFKTLCF